MNTFKIARSYTKSKNKKGMTKVHSYLAILGIIIGIMALIVVSSAMNGFSKDLYKQLKVDSDLTLFLDNNVKNLNQIELDLKNEKIVQKYKVLEMFSSYEITIANEVSMDLKIFKNNIFIKENKSEDLNVIYLAKSLESVVDNKLTTIQLYDKNNVMLDQIILKIKFKEEIRNHKIAYISKKVLEDNLLVDIEGKTIPVIDINLTDFMDSLKMDSIYNKKEGVLDTYSWVKSKSGFFNALQLEQTVIKIVLFFIILVSCVNIISTLNLIITEKKQDIYVLKTIGYSNNQILLIFLIVGIWLGLIGLILGTIAGVVITINLTEILYVLENILGMSFIPQAITKFPYILNIEEIIDINIFTGIIILISSLMPALKTLEMTPAEGLKDE